MMPAVKSLLVGRVSLLHHPNSGKDIAVKYYNSLFNNAYKINIPAFYSISVKEPVSQFYGLSSDGVRNREQVLNKRLLAILSFSINH
jgi:hypothetical protein